MITLTKYSKYILNTRSEIGPGLSQVNSRLFSASVESEKPKQEETELYSVNADEDTEAKLLDREAEIEKKLNKSRLWQQHYNILHGKMPFDEPMSETHNSLKYKRRMFGRYSYQSGVNPGALWPTEEDLKERYDYEKVAYPYTIQEMWENARQRKEAEEKLIEDRQRKIATNLLKLEKWKKEINDRAAAKMRAVAAAKAKKEALIEEVRRHFGFKVDPKDERFKEMLAMKEKDQKKRLKEEKLKAKQAKLLEKFESN